MNNCPYCHSRKIKIHGVTKSGTTRYKCKDCLKTFTGTKVGRPPNGYRAMSNKERQKKYRDKKKIEVIAIEYNSK